MPFFIPLVGLILWMIWKNDRPRDAGMAGRLPGTKPNQYSNRCSIKVGTCTRLTPGGNATTDAGRAATPARIPTMSWYNFLYK